MIRPPSVFVGLRYLRSQRSNHFASFVTGASVLGVALGVAALIVVLSVMNGFENELRGRLLSVMGHGTVLAERGAPWRQWLNDLRDETWVEGAAPYIELEAVLSSGRTLSGALISGVDPALEASVSEVPERMRYGSVEALRAGERSIILGRSLALKLGVGPGDNLTVMVPQREPGGALRTSLRQFRVSGVFELGLSDHDGIRALVHLADAAALAGLGPDVTGVRVNGSDVFLAPRQIREWTQGLTGNTPAVRDWTQENATYFRAVRIEKIMMALLLSLIVGVAAFNIIATLVMVVTDKRGGIAILRTMGYSRRAIVAIFAFQGVVVGWAGVIIGVLLGVFMARNVDSLAPRLEALFGFEFMPADVYYLTTLPTDLHASDVFWVSLVALVMTALATIYPALRAASVAPAEVLRYE